MANLRRFIKAYKDFFTKGAAGDAGLLEGELYEWGANPEIVSRVQDLAGYYPEINLAELAQLPEGTLGYEYARHMCENDIQPLEISADLRTEAQRHPFAQRWIVTHDCFHVLLGFDTSLVGEMGVYGFTVGQNYTKALNLVAPIALSITLAIAPRQIKAIFAGFCRGKELGKQADCLLTYRFEENWARPIADIRAELGLVLADDRPERKGDRAISGVSSRGNIATQS